MTYNINDLPYGTNFIDVNPQNIDPRTGGVLPANFLRPYRGYGGITIRQNTGTTDYNSLQVQLNRRYIRGSSSRLPTPWPRDTTRASPAR